MRTHDILVWIRIWIRVSMPLTNGSGCGSGSCYFRRWLSSCQQKTNFLFRFFCWLLFESTFTSFFKDIKSIKVTKQSRRNQGFSYYFCLVIEGSGSGSGAGSWSIPLTYGSGSRRPKNIWIRRIRIRVRNTACNNCTSFHILRALVWKVQGKERGGGSFLLTLLTHVRDAKWHWSRNLIPGRA